MSVPFDLRNISEKKIPFFGRGKKKKRTGVGGGEGAASVLLIFFSYGEKVNYLIHGGRGGGLRGLVAI